MDINQIYLGDSSEILKDFPDNSIDSCVCDPPYAIKFMNCKWDYNLPSVELWQEVLRALKPGAHALVACGTRKQHRMVVNLEDAGFEVRDVISWITGMGFPKNQDIGKQVKEWEGWGNALKPACEFFTLVRKPLSEKSIAKNVLKWGTGAINIDGCRVETALEELGRFPANLIHDGSEDAKAIFPYAKGDLPDRKPRRSGSGVNCFHGGKSRVTPQHTRSESGSASRFFYCAKASPSERGVSNNHPTVKPLKLISYLCRLITPPNGVCLDPFLGSGTTAIACIDEGFSYIGIEKEPEYHAIALERIKSHLQSKPQEETLDREQLSFL